MFYGIPRFSSQLWLCCIKQHMIVTYADESRGSKVFIRVCLSLSLSLCVCLFVRRIEPK